MEAQFWHDRWLEKDIGFHQTEINRYLLEFWPALDVPVDATVLVPLCGKSRDMVWLAKQGYRVLGVELSEIAAKEFFAELGVEAEQEQSGLFKRYHAHGISILVGDFFALSTVDLSTVAAVYDRASLVALPPEMRCDYVNKLKQILPAGCDTLLITFEYEQGAVEGPPFSIPEAEVIELFGDRCKIRCLDSRYFDLRGADTTEHAFVLQYR